MNYVGQQLGNYRITKLLGQGGFADVYLGQHIHLNTQAAIKVIQAHTSPGDLQIFRKEAQMIATLKHPCIVRVLEFGVEDSTPFLVMDYAENGTLRHRHPIGSILPLATVLFYAKKVASALQYAHDHKVIHCDVKPENMLVDVGGDILLSDFGIAVIAHSTRSQATEKIIGTWAYMSPEQFQGKPRPASDQYALGVTVYEWLSGNRPFQGAMQILPYQHMTEPPPALKKNLQIPSALEDVVQRALAKDPDQRYGTILAFADALETASQILPPRFVSPQASMPSAQPVPQYVSPKVPRAVPYTVPDTTLPVMNQQQLYLERVKARKQSPHKVSKLLYFLGALIAGGCLTVALYPSSTGSNYSGTNMMILVVPLMTWILSIPVFVLIVSQHKQVLLSGKQRIIFMLIAIGLAVVSIFIESTQYNLANNVPMIAVSIGNTIGFLLGLSFCMLALL